MITRCRRLAAKALRIVVLALLIDYGAGWTFDAIVDPARVSGAPPTVPFKVTERPALDLGVPTTAPPFRNGTVPAGDTRVASLFWRDKSWASQYFWGIDQNARISYPIIGDSPEPLRTPFFNVHGWERESYEPSRHDEMPEVWFFGGSTTFGFGQRDKYTIPSYIARIAEQEGTPVRVRNFGQIRFVNWQEMLLFETLLATEKRKPDLAVFYDGINDVTDQLIHPTDQPSYDVFDPHEQVQPHQSWERGLMNSYTEHSVVVRAWRRLFPPAGAQPPDPNAFPKNQAEARALARRVHDIYARGRRLIELMADEHKIAADFFWQPQGLHDAIWFDESEKLVDPPTVDLSGALEGRDVFYDSMHTVETGAKVVAQAEWKTLGPQVREWYRQHAH